MIKFFNNIFNNIFNDKSFFKKNSRRVILWRIVLLALAISPGLISLSRPGFYHTHDGELHLGRFAAVYRAFRDGQIIPRWAADINAGYGHPVLIFQYPLANYLASPFLTAGFSLQTTFKLLIVFSSLVSVVLMFLFLKSMFKTRTAFLGAMFYFYLPYRFLDIYLRGAIGEIMAFALLPAVFLTLNGLFKKPTFRNEALFAVSFALLILSHHGLAFISCPLLLANTLFLIFQSRRKKFRKAKHFTLGAALGLGLCAFFWLPFLTEVKFTKYEEAVGQKYRDHFVFPQQLVSTKWEYGTSDPGKGDTMSFQIGITQVIMVLLSLGVLPFLSWKKRRLYLLFFLSLLFFVFLMLPSSEPLWKLVPVLSRLQFPWRFLFIIGFIVPILISFFLDRVKSRIFFLFLFFILLISNCRYWKPDVHYRLDEKVFDDYPYATTWFDENNPVWQKAPLPPFPNPRFETSHLANLTTVKLKSQSHRLTVESDRKIILTDKTLYFPGWEARIDGKKTSVFPSDPQGLIQFYVPAGQHEVEIVFKETIARQIADFISFASLLLLIIMLTKKRSAKI